nr:hypothetical protein [Pseudomonas savastanoi]
MNANELLDPAYHSFMDEPAGSWTHQTLPGIRARVGAAWTAATAARSEQHWTTGVSDVGIRLCLYRPGPPLEHPTPPPSSCISTVAALFWAARRWPMITSQS